MIITTTDNIEGHEITEYVDIITGDCTISLGTLVRKTDSFKYVMADFNPTSVQANMHKAKVTASKRLMESAEHVGANAVVGIKYETSTAYAPNGDAYAIVSATGTAVKIKDLRTPSPKQVIPVHHPQSYDVCKTAADILHLAEKDNSISPDAIEELKHVVSTERIYGNMLSDALKIIGRG